MSSKAPRDIQVAAKPVPPPLLDFASQAKAALARIEQGTADIETAVKMTRTAWRDYGQALLAQRRIMRDKVAFGRWVKAHKLDTGLAKDSAVRSNAMWMAEWWDDLQDCKTITQHHPTAVRQECRYAGYEWARPDNWEEEKRKKQASWKRFRAERRIFAKDQQHRRWLYKDETCESWQQRKLPDEILHPLNEFLKWSHLQAGTANSIIEEMHITDEDLADLQEYARKSQEVLAQIVEYVKSGKPTGRHWRTEELEGVKQSGKLSNPLKTVQHTA